jgi:uncharacterized protein (TIGR02722 family)
MKHSTAILLLTGVALGTSCSSLQYDDPGKVETLTIDWGSTDLQTLAGGMVESLIGSKNLNYLEQPYKREDKRIVLVFGGVENRTAEHIDTDSIRSKIQTQLVDCGKFKVFADRQGQDEIGEQVRFQQGSGRVDPETARAFGRQFGADVVLYGRLFSIEKSKGRTLESGLYKKDDVYYQFVLECVNIDSGEILWQSEKELRKTERSGIFGS